MMSNLAVQCTAALLCATAATGRASVPVFPDKPVRMVIPLAPGGGSDIVGRIVAQGLSDHWSRPVVVDNRPGAGSIVGTAIVARTPGDGYTLLVSSSSFAISPALHKDSGFDARRDFAGITLLASQPSLLAVHHSVPAKTLKELLALAHARPGALSYGSAGTGSATHLGTELFLHSAKLKMQHIPYKSELRGLAITGDKRTAALPDLPTYAEAGMPNYDPKNWQGMMVPAGTPKAIVDRLSGECAKILAMPVIVERLTNGGMEPYHTGPQKMLAQMKSDHAETLKVVKIANIKMEE